MTDKRTIQYVLGSLMKRPQLLSQVDKYSLTIYDFSNKFERYVFAAIEGLYRKGAKVISPMDVDNYLSSDGAAESTFKSNNGVEYLQDIIDLGNEENFPYYYNKLKKQNLIRDLKKSGIDTSEFYMDDLTNPKAADINAAFEDLTLKDITDRIKLKVAKLDAEYTKASDIESWNVSDEIDCIIQDIGADENVGLPINGDIISTIINGAELGALTIRSLASGVGKTRLAVADACKLAYPIWFNLQKNKWVKNGGNNQKVLFVMTEQKKEQIYRMIIAYLTGIDETKLVYGGLSKDEEKRLQDVVNIIKQYKDNLILLRMPDPNVNLIKTVIREQVLVHNIKYVFFDYVFVSPNLLSEFRGNNLRNDEALLLMATALKDLAVELNVSIFTSTQVNAKIDDNKDIKNESALAGGRSTINKADNGIIGARPTQQELELLKDLGTSIDNQPNLVFDVFKVRSGRWTQVRIWCNFNPGILRLETLFLTDARLNPINDFYNYQPTFDWDMSNEDSQFLSTLNN